jgi:CheY-like chemotaxis protein
MSKTLLLADDSVTIQKVVGLSFASEDVVLVTVSNGDDALSRARELRPDVVLADVVMPGKNGYEVCEAIKADPNLRHIPVLLLTGTFEAFDQERARRVGADGHVTKPFEAQALVHQVKELMARAAQPAVAPDAVGWAAPAGPAEDPFFDDDLAVATSFGSDALELDVEAAAGELEFATVAEEDDILGATDLAALPPATPAHAEPVSEPFEAPLESFRGSPVFSPERTESDLRSPRAVAPAPANVLPDDDFDLGFDDVPYPTAAAASPGAPGAPLPPASRFGEDDPTRDTAIDPGQAGAYDLSFADLDDPLGAARGESMSGPAFELAPTPTGPGAPEIAGIRAETATVVVGAASGAAAAVDLSPVLRQRLHDTLEKVAWEAFADLSDTIVRQALERIESIAWEVIPQMAEQLIREEIRRMKGDDEES